jgi:hypothetical protein
VEAKKHFFPNHKCQSPLQITDLQRALMFGNEIFGKLRPGRINSPGEKSPNHPPPQGKRMKYNV